MLVTIVADASFCPETNVSSFAAVATKGFVKKTYSGVLTFVDRSSDAEALAVRKGIIAASKSGLIHCGDTLLIYTDCHAVISLLEGRKPKPYETHQEGNVCDWIQYFVKQQGVEIEVKHLRGHKHNPKTPIDFDHNKCDAISRKIVRSQRDKFLRMKRYHDKTV